MITRNSYLGTLFISAMLFTLTSIVLSEESNITVEDIFKRMSDKYATCSSYQDSGIVEITLIRESDKTIDKLSFKTYFARPNLFRLEWSSQRFPEKRVVWCDGKDIYTFREPDRYRQEKDLSDALSDAPDSRKILCLLLKEYRSSVSLTNLSNLSLVREERIDGERCYLIKGQKHLERMSDISYELWIGKKDYLLRKSKGRMKFGGALSIVEEIHREIKLNQEIPREIFAYKPPEGVLLTGTAQAREIGYAIEAGNLARVKELLKANPALIAKANGTTPLHMVAYYNQNIHKEIAKFLLANGADVNAKDKTSQTPLYWATGYGSKEIVELLLAHGADVNAKGQYGTPLHLAVDEGRNEMVKLLLANSADVNARNKRGYTPLHLAIQRDRKEMIELLRRYGGVE